MFQNDRNQPTATIQNPFLGSPVTGTPAALVMLGYLQPDGRSFYKNNHIWQWSTEIEKSWGKELGDRRRLTSAVPHRIWKTRCRTSTTRIPGRAPCKPRRPYQYYVDSRDPSTLLPLGTIRRLESWASSNYNALQSRLEKRSRTG